MAEPSAPQGSEDGPTGEGGRSDLDTYIRHYENQRRSLGSIAKYSIAVLSALIVFFPSTYTFVQPPYKFDYLLIPAILFATFALYYNSITILHADFEEDTRLPRVKKLCARGALLTIFSVCFVFVYVVVNVVSDRISYPRIVAFTIEPLNPKVGELVQLSAGARDDDNDYLNWSWFVEQLESLHGDKTKLPSEISTAYWMPDTPGEYEITVFVKDDARSSEIARLRVIAK